jgi:tripartite-type tricarboxylate transporter receptor subunit TctC
MHNLFFRHSLLGILGLLIGTASIAQTAPWPIKPVKFINSFPPGGPSDILARAVGDVLQKQFNQAFVVENKAGASGNVGADAVAKSAADGYTLLWGIDTTHTINPHIYKTMPFKEADLKPVMVIASSGLLVGVHPGTQIKTLPEFMQVARQRSLNFSSGGNGSPGHLWVNMANLAAATRLVHVPYRGNSPAVLAVVAGEVDGGTLATTGMLPQVKSNKVTALATTSRKRSRVAPEIPTVGELGHKELESEVVYVVMVPGHTPESTMQTLSKALLDALNRAELQSKIQDLDMAYEGLSGSAAVNRLKGLSDHYGRVIRATGMKVD